MTNHADLIAALRIPMNVTFPGAPELDEYDEQRKAAADALEAAWDDAYRRGQEDMRESVLSLMPRYFAGYSSTGVTVGVWDDGYVASEALSEYPGGEMIEMLDVSAIRALPIKEKDDE